MNLFWSLLLCWILCAPMQAQPRVNQSGVTFRETVWLQTPRHIYLSGERIEFQASLLERDTYKPSALSKYIRIELMDSTGNKLHKQILELAGSQVKGFIVLSPDLKSGWYYLRAYTNWMRNFPESEFSLMPVKVVNLTDGTLGTEAPAEKEATDHAGNKTAIQITELVDQLIIEIRNLNPDSVSTLRLLVHRSYSWYWFESKKITSGTLSFKVPVNQVPKGLVQFSIITEKNRVLSSRLWSNYDYSRHEIVMNPLPYPLKIQDTCRVDFQIPETMDASNILIMNALIALHEPGNQDNGFIPGLPGWRADAMIPTGKQLFGQWLTENSYPDQWTQTFFPAGSSEPVSPDELNLPPLNRPGILFFPETRAPVLCGRVFDKISGNGIPSVGIGVTILNDNGFDAIKTDQDGEFHFAFPNRRYAADYILSFISMPDSTWIIDVFPEYDNRTFKPKWVPFILSGEELQYAANLNINHQLNLVYAQPISGDKIRTDTLVRKKTFYDPPERTIYTDDYIELASVLEVVYEVVPDVQVHRKGNQAWLSVYNKNPFARDYETLILLDGIPITSHKELLDLPPGRIKAIEIKNKIYVHGNYLFSAIVNFISRNGDFAGLRLPGQSVPGSFDLPATAEPSHQNNPGPASPAIPVLNPVQLWDTGLVPSAGKISFSLNDLYGDFRIMIYGFDQNGQWFFGQKPYKVIARSF